MAPAPAVDQLHAGGVVRVHLFHHHHFCPSGLLLFRSTFQDVTGLLFTGHGHQRHALFLQSSREVVLKTIHGYDKDGGA